MKVFIWTNVLKNYGYGCAVAVADTVFRAKQIIIEKYKKELMDFYGWKNMEKEHEEHMNYMLEKNIIEPLQEPPKYVLDMSEEFVYLKEGGE